MGWSTLIGCRNSDHYLTARFSSCQLWAEEQYRIYVGAAPAESSERGIRKKSKEEGEHTSQSTRLPKMGPLRVGSGGPWVWQLCLTVHPAFPPGAMSLLVDHSSPTFVWRETLTPQASQSADQAWSHMGSYLCLEWEGFWSNLCWPVTYFINSRHQVSQGHLQQDGVHLWGVGCISVFENYFQVCAGGSQKL